MSEVTVNVPQLEEALRLANESRDRQITFEATNLDGFVACTGSPKRGPSKDTVLINKSGASLTQRQPRDRATLTGGTERPTVPAKTPAVNAATKAASKKSAPAKRTAARKTGRKS